MILILLIETHESRVNDERRAREAKREREKREKKAQEEKGKVVYIKEEEEKKANKMIERQKKAEEIQDKLAERAFLMNVEELLTDFNWKANGSAAVLEKQLLGELHALEAVSLKNTVCRAPCNITYRPMFMLSYNQMRE